MDAGNKRVGVVAGDRVLDAELRAGVTAQDVLKQLGLPADYCLSRRDGLAFGDTEAIYGLVNEGEKLYATPVAEVGRQPTSPGV